MPEKKTIERAKSAERRGKERDLAKGQTKEPVSPRRSRVSAAALKKENSSAASPRALSRQAKSIAKRRRATAAPLAESRAYGGGDCAIRTFT